MKTILFGATGYLGSHVAEQLSRAGHDVVCVVRATSNTNFLKTLAVAIEHADFSDHASLGAYIESDSTVLNCIAETRMHLSDDERRVVECALTSALYSAAQKAGARRFIQLSTVMVYGFDRPEYAIDESYPVSPKYSYSRIACEREQTLIEQYPAAQTELLILRPSNTFGQRDSSALPVLLASHQKGLFVAISGGDWRFSCMDARDVGRAMVHLLGVPVSNPEIFLVKGYDTSWLDVKSALDALLKRGTRLMNLPRSLGMLLGRLMEIVYPYGKQPPLTRFNVEVLGSNTLFDDSKIRASGFQSKYKLLETLSEALTDLHEAA